jgi:PTS system ascorbate-specific IIC component
MNVLLSIWNVVFNQFLTVPALLLAVIVALGYALLRRPALRVVSGAIKTAVGVLILQVGAGQLTSTFRPLLEALSAKFGMTGTIIDPYAALPAANVALGESRAAWIGYTIIIALLCNILLVALTKYTKLRGVFMTGHVMFLQSALVTAVVAYVFNLSLLPTVLLAGILTGLYWSIGSHLLIKPVDQITNGAGFTIAHQQMFYDWFVSKTAHHIGDPEKDNTENLTLPGWLSILQDNVVAMAIIMTIFMTVLMLAIGPATVQEMAGTRHWTVHILLTGLSFAVNVTIILTGVRMFVAELANSFKGVSERLLKGAVVGVDCPAIFPFAPNAWILGFLFTTLGQIVAILVLVLLRSPAVIIAGFVPLFFDGGTVGVFSNKFGGFKAVAFFGVVLGLLQVFLAALMVPMTGFVDGWMGNFDWASYWLLVTTVLHSIAALVGLDNLTAAARFGTFGNLVAIGGVIITVVLAGGFLLGRARRAPATKPAKAS